MLNRLIASIKEQETDNSFHISITVVDNDREGSAAEIVAKIEKGCSLPIHYVIEPQQNISLARNRALTSTEADYYACIDDDELADKVWLLSHYKTIVRHRAAGVLALSGQSMTSPRPPGLSKEESWNARNSRRARHCLIQNIVEQETFSFLGN